MEENISNITNPNGPSNIKPETPKGGKGPVVGLVVVIVIALVGIGGTWYYMNNKAKNDKKASEAQIQQLQKQADELSQSVRALDSAAILSQAKGAFSYWIGGSTPSNPKTYQTMKDAGYITQALVDFQKNPPKYYDVLTCSQNALPYSAYVFKDPAVQDAKTASMNVEGKYDSGVNVITLGLVKDSGVWKINTVSCPTQDAVNKS